MSNKEPGYVYILTNPSFFMLVGHDSNTKKHQK